MLSQIDKLLSQNRVNWPLHTVLMFLLSFLTIEGALIFPIAFELGNIVVKDETGAFLFRVKDGIMDLAFWYGGVLLYVVLIL